MSLVSATDDNFETEVLKSDTPVLVDFWAEWCPPCKQLLPIVEELAGEMDSIKVVKVNIDENPEIPTKYGVRGIPTLMISKGGELVDTKVGAYPKSDLESWIAEKA